MFYILIFLSFISAPAKINTKQPSVAVLNLTSAGNQSENLINTTLRVNPSVSLVTNSVFSPSDKKSLLNTLKTLPPFPSKLSKAVLRRQLSFRKLNALVILASKGIYILSKYKLSGPWNYPAANSQLSPSFVSELIKISQGIPVHKPVRKGRPWWKSYVFWGGVVFIASSILLLSQVNQEPDTVEINLKY